LQQGGGGNFSRHYDDDVDSLRGIEDKSERWHCATRNNIFIDCMLNVKYILISLPVCIRVWRL
jgi:hypothetical protein